MELDHQTLCAFVRRPVEMVLAAYRAAASARNEPVRFPEPMG